MMRIITGSAKGTKLDAPEGLSTRPTAERTKEGIFNTIQFDIKDKTVLELFGGSGQMSLEALSRGAKSATICDNDENACAIIRKNAKKTRFEDKITLLQCDFKTAIKKCAGKKFDIVILDPPYKSDLLDISLFRVFDAGLVNDGGYVICETDREEPLSNKHAELFRHTKYSRAFVTYLKKKPTAKAIVTGSFDPVTVGHLDLIKRAAKNYDEVYAVIFVNPEKTYLLPLEKRLELLKSATDGLKNVTVDSDGGYVVDYMRSHGIKTIVRGIRNDEDLKYESEMAQMNKSLYDECETVFYDAEETHKDVSSTKAREEIEKNGHSSLCPWL